MNETKKCIVCGKVLPMSEFAEDKRSKDGYRRTCKVCAGVHETRLVHSFGKEISRTVKGGIESLKGISTQDILAELRFRGYKGQLQYTREVVV